MQENIIQEYLVYSLPAIIGKYLTKDPIPNMNETIFTLQITITGEKSLTFGVTIKNAADIAITPGAMENPMVAITLTDDIIRPIVSAISTFISRKQYDVLKDKRGSVDLEIDMPGDWKLPVHAVINGSSEPSFKMSGSLETMSGMATGEVDPTKAFMDGKIKLNGDVMFAMALTDLAPKK
jgi:hypothetical protein